jgi:membrane protein implicated in regulation of membrane protease activity
MHWSFWAVSAVVLLIVEIITPGTFFFACLSVGAAVTVLFSLFHVPLWAQWLAFMAVSVLSIYFIRPFATKFFVVQKKKSNVDALVGQDAWVTEPIDPPNMGMVKVVGSLWRAEGMEKIDKEKWVTILAVKGSHLVVKSK